MSVCEGLILLVLKENSTPVCLEKDFSSESIRMDLAVIVMGLSNVALLTCAVALICKQVNKVIINREDIYCTIFKFELTAAVSTDEDTIALLLVRGIEGSVDDIEYIG